MRFIHCPACGSLLASRTLGDEGAVPYCERCARPWFDMFSSCVIAAVLNAEGEVALLREARRPALEVLVAGYIQPGESAEEAMRREIREELGLDVTISRLAWTCWHPKGDQLMTAFVARAPKTDFRLSAEVLSAAWVPLEEALLRVPPQSIAQRLVQEAAGDVPRGVCILLRGNSGSGKTTTAQALQKQLGAGTMLISQDAVRRELLHVKDRPGNPAIELMADLARWGSARGKTVILEGILDSALYAPVFQALPGLFRRVHAYYFDLPFEETLRRHQGRAKAGEFGEEAMRRWWKEKDFVPQLRETVLTAGEGLEEIVARILGDVAAQGQAADA